MAGKRKTRAVDGKEEESYQPPVKSDNDQDKVESLDEDATNVSKVEHIEYVQFVSLILIIY